MNPISARGYPSIAELIEDRIAYRNHENIYFVDDEHTHLDAVSFFANFAKWVADSATLPHQITTQDLEMAAKMGTFEYQMGGRLKEGIETTKVHHTGG